MVFHWGLSDMKPPQVSVTSLVVWPIIILLFPSTPDPVPIL